LALTGSTGAVYNIASGVDVEIAEIARMLLDLVGTDLELRLDESLMRPVDIPVLRGDAERLRQATSWAPQIPLATTLADVLDSFRN